MPDEHPGAGDGVLAPVIGKVLSMEWGGPADHLVSAWPDARFARQAEDVQTLIVPQVPLGKDAAARAECTFTWEGLVSVSLTPVDAGDAAFQALCAHVTGELGGVLRQADLGYLTATRRGTRVTIDRLDRVVRLEEAP